MEFEQILYAVDSPVGVITLNRPSRRNAQGYQMLDELEQAFEQARRDDAVRVLVLRGTDGVFSTGHDLAAPRSCASRAASSRRPRLRTSVSSTGS